VAILEVLMTLTADANIWQKILSGKTKLKIIIIAQKVELEMSKHY